MSKFAKTITSINSNTTMTTENDFNPDVPGTVDMATAFAIALAKKIIEETVTKAIKVITVREKFPKPSGRLQRMAEPSRLSYVNLYNNHRSVLTPDKVLRLEQKLAEMGKYSQVISDDLKVLIVDKINGITPSQSSILETRIMECLAAYVKQCGTNTNVMVPKFLEASYNFKCLKVVCADKETVGWLKETIATLSPPPWPEARLEVTFMSTYSVYSTTSVRRTPKSPNEGRIKFAIPNNTATTALTSAATTTVPSQEALAADAKIFTDIAADLVTHNNLMSPDSWKELWRDDKGAYTMYYVSMQLDCIEEIRKKGNRLFYKLGTIKVAPFNSNDDIAYKKKMNDAIKVAAKRELAKSTFKP